jgi:hypothetical protein
MREDDVVEPVHARAAPLDTFPGCFGIQAIRFLKQLRQIAAKHGSILLQEVGKSGVGHRRSRLVSHSAICTPCKQGATPLFTPIARHRKIRPFKQEKQVFLEKCHNVAYVGEIILKFLPWTVKPCRSNGFAASGKEKLSDTIGGRYSRSCFAHL